MSRVIDVKKRVLEENERAASGLRKRFAESKTLVTNLISSPGSGKTTLLEETLKRMKDHLTGAVLVGDVATERDAERIRATGLPAHQILTGGACHLDARQIMTACDEAKVGTPDILFIENVGNLICPTSYDLGEDFKVVLLSVAEGDDKPFKYPAIFSRAEVTVITKADLLEHSRFDMKAVRDQVSSLNPEAEIVITSSYTGEGMGEWCELLERRLEVKRSTVPPAGQSA